MALFIETWVALFKNDRGRPRGIHSILRVVFSVLSFAVGLFNVRVKSTSPICIYMLAVAVIVTGGGWARKHCSHLFTCAFGLRERCMPQQYVTSVGAPIGMVVFFSAGCLVDQPSANLCSRLREFLRTCRASASLFVAFFIYLERLSYLSIYLAEMSVAAVRVTSVMCLSAVGALHSWWCIRNGYLSRTIFHLWFRKPEGIR